jgi:LmbE family N-acetylglucosaminyl deacetylase
MRKTDMLDLSKCQTALTFFAHPDDETLAAGAAISKLVELGIDVHIAIPATGIHSRSNVQDRASRDADLMELRIDCQKAMRLLGVLPDNIYLGEFPDNEMDKHSLLETVHWLEAIIKRVKPEVIFTHHRYCTNIDHQYCHEAAVVAARPDLESHISIICGEVPSSTGYLRPVQWEPNLYIEVSERSVEAKIKAMETYKGEARLDPHPRSGEVLRALAKVRGSEAGFLFAEAFMIQRIFG